MEIEEFFATLKECMEKRSRRLRRGRIFLPKYLKAGVVESAFRSVASLLARELNLKLHTQVFNRFLPEYEIGGNQRADFVFTEMENDNTPILFLELETLDGSQLYHFRDHDDIGDEDNLNKLWFYYGTLGNRYTLGTRARLPAPRYFVFFLSLPDQPVGRYKIWDMDREYGFLHRSLKELVYQNPYRFYDHLIKTSARLFLESKQKFLSARTSRGVMRKLKTFQNECELVLITCTKKELILSRGSDFFRPEQENRVGLNWQ